MSFVPLPGPSLGTAIIQGKNKMLLQRIITHMNKHTAPSIAPPSGPYSQAITTSGLVFCSGCIGVNEKGVLVEGIAAQTKQAIYNLSAVLESANSSLNHVVKVNVMLKNMSDFEEMNRVYAQTFVEAKGPDGIFPARTTFAVADLPKKALIMVDAEAIMTPISSMA